MKGLFSTIPAILSVAIAVHAADAVTGRWQVHQNINGNESDLACTFAQTGDELAGSCAVPDRTMKFTVKISEKTVTWTVQTEYNGAPLTMKYSGTLASATKITGTVSVEQYHVEGEFTATNTK